MKDAERVKGGRLNVGMWRWRTKRLRNGNETKPSWFVKVKVCNCHSLHTAIDLSVTLKLVFQAFFFEDVHDKQITLT